MGSITVTAPTLNTVVPNIVLATGNMDSVRTLDLTTAHGAWVTAMIGRRAATALTSPGRMAIRRRQNGSNAAPMDASYDRLSSIAAAASNTLNGAVSAGAASIVLTSATGFAAGDVICISASGGAMATSRIVSISTNTLTLADPLEAGFANGDAVTNQCDVFPALWLPGGDTWEFRFENYSGQSLVGRVEASPILSYTTN